MIASHLSIKCIEDKNGKVYCEMKLTNVRARNATMREMEYLEFALRDAVYNVNKDARKLQRQARTRSAHSPLVGTVKT
jgi:hypothetical protein